MSVKKELQDVKVEVEGILAKSKLARGNDFYLVICYLREKGIEIPRLTPAQYKSLSGSISTVLRVRRVIQNTDGNYLPSKKIQERRDKRSYRMRNVKYHEL